MKVLLFDTPEQYELANAEIGNRLNLNGLQYAPDISRPIDFGEHKGRYYMPVPDCDIANVRYASEAEMVPEWFVQEAAFDSLREAFVSMVSRLSTPEEAREMCDNSISIIQQLKETI